MIYLLIISVLNIVTTKYKYLSDCIYSHRIFQVKF